jgi:hypothetical protein
VDNLRQQHVRDHASTEVMTIRSDETVEAALARVSGASAERTHNGFPVVTADGRLVGVVTRRDLDDPKAARSRPVGARSDFSCASEAQPARSTRRTGARSERAFLMAGKDTAPC